MAEEQGGFEDISKRLRRVEQELSDIKHDLQGDIRNMTESLTALAREIERLSIWVENQRLTLVERYPSKF